LRSTDNTTVVTATRAAGSGSLLGTTNKVAAGGVVTFTNLAPTVATNITIQFTSSNLLSATSTSIAVNAGAATRLGLQTQPSASATAGLVFSQQPVVRIEDAFGNLVTTDNSLTRPWKVMKNYRRLPDIEWGENNCIEGQTWVTIGTEVYYLSGDGTIMPTKKGQAPPDLKYFPQAK